ncbi:MAG: hypothetical protein KDI75_08355 [Xanthomonadales bacterium]|nr:hypothetical protein [Xanthomonadales bacterium]
MKGSIRLLAGFALLTLLVACSGNARRTALDRTLYAYHSAIRWGDIDTAWRMVDPEYREAHPLSSIDRSRYDQYSVSGYYEQGRSETADGVLHQVVQIALINRHTQTEKVMVDQQSWRWDEATETWWLTSGLPDYRKAR